MDPLSVVYEKRGNTGGAAYTGPTFTIGNNPLDEVARQIGAQKNYLQKIDLANEAEQEAVRKKEAVRDKLNKGVLAKVNFDGMAADNKKYFTQLTIDHKIEGAKLKDAGYDLTDWSVPEVADWNTRGQKNLDVAKASKEQGVLVQRIANEVYNHIDQYDVKKTEANIQAYLNTPPVDRIGIDPNTLKVELEDPFDAYVPVKSVNVSDYLTLGRLRDQVKLIAANPLNEKHFQKGVDQKAWADRQQYEDALYEYLKPQWAPRQTSGGNSGFGSGSGFGDNQGPITFSNYATTVYDPHTKSTVNSLAPNGVQLGAINVIVGPANARSAADNTPLSKSTNIVSGYMSTPFVLNNGEVASIPYDPSNPSKTHTATIAGTLYTNKTYDQIVADLISKNKGKYKPMLYGQYKLGSRDKFAWVDASSIINGTDKSIRDAKVYYDQQVVEADALNSRYKTPSAAKPAAKPAATTTKKKKVTKVDPNDPL
jgi:hypothetical protein